MKPPASNAAAPRFDVAALRARTGEAAFTRGAAYHAAGRVEILSIQAGRVVAKVLGSEVYDAALETVGGDLSGACNCPAFEDWGFCKHLAAVALAANDLGQDQAERLTSATDDIRDHLRSLGTDALVTMVLEQAERDPALMRRIRLSMAAARGDDKALSAQFRKAITAATRTGDGIGYREARDWARQIGEVLDGIAGLVDGGRAQIGLDLIDHALARLETALGDIDDSDGHALGLLHRAGEIHLRACHAARPDPVGLARLLFKREMESDWDTFADAGAIYAGVLGRDGLAEYRRLADAAWAQIPSRRADERRRPHAPQDYSSNFHRLFAILDGFAEREGDIDARVALRSKDLSTARTYEKLIELCIAHDRAEAALKWAEEGLWLFRDASADRLARQAADLYLRAGRKADAEALLWRCFEQRPRLDILQQLKGLAGDTALDRAVGLVRDRLAGRRSSAGWGYSDADFLIRLFLAEGRLADAWAVADTHGCPEATLLDLCAASETTFPSQAIAVYERLVESRVGQTNQQGYEGACKLIDRIGRVRKTSGETAIHATYLAGLAARHKAKRNFMKLLAAR